MWVEHLQTDGKSAFCPKVPIQLQGKGCYSSATGSKDKEKPREDRLP